MALILDEFPEISKTVLDGHFYEDRKRAYFTQRYDRGAAAFLNEFKKLKRRLELVASDTLETKDLIVAMGVSLVVGAAAQRSFDRCVE